MTKQRREHEEETHRRLRRALFWSLAGHGLLVFAGGLLLPQVREGFGTAINDALLTARLVRPAPLASLASLPTPPKSAPAPRVEPERRPPVVATERAADVVSAVPPAPPGGIPSVASTPAVPAAVEAQERAAPGPVAAVPNASVAAPRQAAMDAVGEGLDANALRGYRLALAVQARRFKRYPAQATAQGWAGTAEVRLTLAAGGRPDTATLTRSSGYEVLDRAALAMMNAAVQQTPVPASLQEKAFAVTLPVVFNLDE